MAEIFGPGGLLEKCMPAGYEHRRSQLEMAELVDEAFRQAAPSGRSRHGHGQNAGLSDSGDSQRTARGDLHGHEIASGAALHQRRAVRAEAFRSGAESRGDEGPGEFSVPAESPPDGRPAGAEGHGGTRLVHADTRLGAADGDRRPRGAEFSARRRRAVGEAGRAARNLHGAEVRGVQPLLRYRDAPSARPKPT